MFRDNNLKDKTEEKTVSGIIEFTHKMKSVCVDLIYYYSSVEWHVIVNSTVFENHTHKNPISSLIDRNNVFFFFEAEILL